MTTALRLSTISLPHEYTALVVTVAGVVITPAFFGWAYLRYLHRPSRQLLGLCISVLIAFSVQIIRLIGSNYGDYSRSVSSSLSINIYYPGVLFYCIMQTGIMRMFLPYHLRHWAFRAQIVIGVIYCCASPGTVCYLAKMVIRMYANQEHSEFTEAVKHGIRINQICLSIGVIIIVLADFIAIILMLFFVPRDVSQSTSVLIQNSYKQIGFGLAPFHTIGGTILLERMKDFKNIAEHYRLNAIQKSLSNQKQSPLSSNAFHIPRKAGPSVINSSSPRSSTQIPRANSAPSTTCAFTTTN
ncbi:hypothetical protein BATDEDRAFT_24593 [Batrachochytrium dendrobatidis JAM81]|uniref:Uncharacterized protein n=2 Tax=Batrachochytrium dendrobatidis TaxID=109871 RepID=F4P1T3_BATDJ|nr:uncharacterized protein BATDEDRAFT_24593 [Batrachochytrium dendrobatidis JAM81]EGF80736.1 hypothetical protein BATDEDRAFT_24593 [Batrachochytrium dendrobatidis JAM81]|eukprot:XP_006678494.1 hypothetical protein BATDEDRAFT_24593 [Batrachochytrium dendrobatidis JAM81]